MKSLFLFGIAIFVLIACNSTENEDIQTTFAGKWVSNTYIFNGQIGIDTCSITQKDDSLTITHSDLSVDSMYLKNDTIFPKSNTPVRVDYYLIKSHKKLVSNYPVNRTIDSIVLNKIY